MRVLVIDDEPDVLLLCRVNFEFAGHEVLEAPDAERGMEAAVNNHPDVIVLDIMLPRKDGLTLLQELHERPDTADIPVVLLTARTQSADQLRGFRAGADEYVTKPFSPTALTHTVQRVGEMSADERRRHREEAVAALAGAQ
jgi:two-component system alkaline phosphatase synthesis response regulator PhoP